MSEAPSTFTLMLRLGLSLGLVLALVGVVTWVLRRRGLLRPANSSPTGRLEVLDRKALGKRASLVVARVGGTAVLVGVTDTHISVLSEAPGLDGAWVDPSADEPDTVDTSTSSITPPGPTVVDLSALDAVALASAMPTMEARRIGLRGDSLVESTTPSRMSFVATLRELTVRRS